jgi:hypothetical protein
MYTQTRHNRSQSRSTRPFFWRSFHNSTASCPFFASASGKAAPNVQTEHDQQAEERARQWQGMVQPKLTMGSPGDPFEREADRAADRVVQRMESAAINQAGTPVVQAVSENCGKAETTLRRQVEPGNESELLQTKAETAAGAVPDPVRQSLEGSRAGGQALNPELQGEMEGAFRRDFSGVRVHTGDLAEDLNRQLSARAFTHGQDIFFNSGEFSPDTRDGRHLLAHELTHVVQQADGRTLSLATASVVQRKSGYPKTVMIENAEVEVASKEEEAEATKIIGNIKQRYGISFDAQKGLKALKDLVVGDPEQPRTVTEVLANPNAPARKVKDLLAVSTWNLGQLRDVDAGLAFFRNVLGLNRSLSNRSTNSQELTTLSRLNIGLNDANTTATKDVYGQFFVSVDHAAFFNAAGSATELADKNKAFLGIVVHEVAHAILGKDRDQFVSGLKPAYWKDENTPSNDANAEKPVTSYGGKNAGEDLAEAVKFYLIEPETLRKKCPQRYAIVNKLITNLGKVTSQGPKP